MNYLISNPPVTHPTLTLCKPAAWYCTFNYDSLVSSGIAIVFTMAIVFAVAYSVNTRVPGKLQMVLELLFYFVRSTTYETVDEDARFVIPLAATIGLYILIANWLDIFPLPQPLVHPAASDLNQTLAMALIVIVLVQGYSLRVLGLKGYFRRFTKPFELPLWARILFIPLNVIEEVAKPLTLSVRLFGNILAGLVMLWVITVLLPIFVAPIGVVIWKAFDVLFIGAIQAFIFMLLTIVYFGMAREGLAEEAHEGSKH
jgi:F-type H+-transporting ATPase subunit a